MKNFSLLIVSLLMCACSQSVKKSSISPEAVDKVINAITEKGVLDGDLLEKGVKQTARLWQAEDGTETDFADFCKANYIADADEKEKGFLRISDYLEALYGNFNEMSLALQRNVHENTGPLLAIDEVFSAFNPATHLSNDLYANKLAFIITLNYPKLTLEEKESLGDNRLSWAYARLGDVFTSRVPAELQQAYSLANSDADVYIAGYNIYAGKLLDRNGEKQFPEDMILLSHWNLRDEIKANYSLGEKGLGKQETIYEVMKRIVSQEIPEKVINSGEYEWNPYENTVSQNGQPVEFSSENGVRYEKFLNNFNALKAIDAYTGDTYIDRNFSDDMEVSVEDAEKLLREYLSSPELKKLGEVIQSRLGRNLQAFDIWYDGFKSRSTMNEDKLSELTRKLYPNAEALEKDLPSILLKLGFEKDRAKYIADKIEVDAARGSGHAWGAAHKGQKAHLRTRIPSDGMDYKGYNIAIHEFGHNVEQTISLYDVDYYMLNGVPNTAFTEALAFVFQKRDLDILGISDNNPEKTKNDIMDKAWQLSEIAGVSLLDIEVWKWLYKNPNATPQELQNETIRLAKEIWNQYYSPVFGTQDEPILAIYSHMVSYPLYLSAYAFGQIIEFQLEQYLNGKNFATEVDRIYRLGRLTPNQWIIQATGSPLSVEPLLEALQREL
ncbi:hypothetical protein LJC52_04465 [Bacteroidales bacterium OttesenSCG-928-A17]|nr:hypothetical protein [Bacteroidales bacterium OttesenSCG-928-A17]